MATSLTNVLLLGFATLAGCAADGIDAPGSAGGGGKSDDGGEQGLHVRTVKTQLGPDNAISWPQAVDAESDVDDKINAALSFETITGENLEEITSAWATDPEEVHPGLQSVNFTVDGNVRNVLSLTINQEYLGAYIDFSSSYHNFNSNTGAPVGITDILTSSSLPTIASVLDKELQSRIAELKTELAAEIASGEVEASTWDDLHVTAESLEAFSATSDGITFHYDPGFPHVIQALEPSGEFEVSIDALDAAISPTGLWANEY